MFDLNYYNESEPHITNDKCTYANAFVENTSGHMKCTFKWENMSDRLNVCVFISFLISLATSINAELQQRRKPKKAGNKDDDTTPLSKFKSKQAEKRKRDASLAYESYEYWN